MKSCLQVTLAIIVGLFAVIGIIVVAIFFLIPKSNPPARPTPTVAPTDTVVIAAIATPIPAATTLPTEMFTPSPSNTSVPTPAIAATSTTEQIATATFAPTLTSTPFPPTTTPAPIAVAIVQPQIFLPAIKVVPTPTEIEFYRSALAYWILELQAWAVDLESIANSDLPISSPEWNTGFDNLERRLQEQTQSLQAMVAPYGYISAKEILVTGMESCGYAVRFLRDGEASYFQLYMATCTLAIEMATTKMIFAPAK